MQPIAISIVIPHYNDHAHLKALLESLDRELAANSALRATAAIVDDGSTAECRARLSEAVARYRWLSVTYQTQNRGAAAARNAGARLGTGEWLWFLDTDVVLCHGAIAMILPLLREDVDGLVTGLSKTPLAKTGFARHKAYLNFYWQPPDGPTKTIDTKSFLLRRKCFERVKGFDDSYRGASVEDYELCARLLADGCRLLYTRAETLAHHEPSFRRELILFYRRAREWMRLKRSRGAIGFDDNGTTGNEALAQLAAFGTIVSFGIVPFATRAGFAVAFVFATLYVLIVSPRLAMLRRLGEKPAFLVMHVLYGLALSLPVVLGATIGALGGKSQAPAR